MPSTLALLTLPGSALGDALRPRIEARGMECRVLDMDAPLTGKPVTIRPRRVTWEGFELLLAGALLIEKPVFPWPQPMHIETLPPDGDGQARALTAEREARALIVSAIRVAAESLPVVNPPDACHFAAAPATALDRAAAAGVPVARWRLQPAVSLAAGTGTGHSEGGNPDGPAVLTLDPVGNDRWHAPSPPKSGEPALVVDVPPGPVTTVLVVGDRVAAAVRHEDARAWAWRGLTAGQPLASIDPPAAETGVQAARACALHLAAVALGGSPSAVIALDPAPDVSAWGRITEGRILDALAGHLVHLAARQEASA
jgi:hypothetical protein